MTERDDIRAVDRRLRDALRALPATRPGEDFTDEVLARLDRRASRRAAAARPRRLRQLALTAAAAAALAVAVGNDGLRPAGPWLRFGAGTDLDGSGKEGAPADGGAGAPQAKAAGKGALGGGSDAKTGMAEAPRGSEGARDLGRPEATGPGAAGSGTGGSGEEGRPADTRRPPRSLRAPSDAAALADPSGQLATAGPDGASPTASAAALRGSASTGAGTDPRAARTPLAGRSFAAAGPPELTGAEAAARLALLRHERERLLADLRALRAAVPPEEPAGLLLAGGESLDLVLGLGAGAARPSDRRPGASEVRPAVLQQDDRPPRLD